MSLRAAIVFVLVFLLAAPAARAQEPVDPRLAPGSFVVVHLKNGASVKGHVVQVADDALTVLPRTRMAVPARTFAFADIESIEARKKEGLSVGGKVLLGIGIVFGLGLIYALSNKWD